MSIFTETGSKLVGIGGLDHSGKTTGGDHLAREHGFMHVSINDVLREEARQQGLETKAPTLIAISLRLRERQGSGAIVLRGIEQWRQQRSKYLGGLVVSSISVVGEAEEIKRQEGTLLFIDSPAWMRYDRSTDGLSAEQIYISLTEYVELEQIELLGLGGPNRPHLQAIQAMADKSILNIETIAAYTQDLEAALSLPRHTPQQYN